VKTSCHHANDPSTIQSPQSLDQDKTQSPAKNPAGTDNDGCKDTKEDSRGGEEICYTGHSDIQDLQDTQETQGYTKGCYATIPHYQQFFGTNTSNTVGTVSDDYFGSNDQPGWHQFLEELTARIPSTLPLPEYIAAAVRYNQIQVEKWHESGGPWMTSVWYFTWLMKGHPQLTDLSVDEAKEVIDEVFATSDYFKNERDNPWLELPFYDSSNSGEPEIEFLTNWDKVRCAPGRSPLDEAIRKSNEIPLEPSRCEDGKLPLYKKFVSVAGHLQVTMGNQNILLPCEKLAGVLGTNKMMISRMRHLAVRDGYLKVVKESRFRSKGNSEATEFRFDVSIFEGLGD